MRCARFPASHLTTCWPLVNELYAQVARLASAPPGAAPPTPGPGLDPGQRLAARAQLVPEPLSRWLSVVARSGATLSASGTRASIAAAAAQQLAPFCNGVESRFPFRQDPAAPDVPMSDFVRLFSPGGIFDQFFAQSLRSYVDTTSRPWRTIAADGVTSPATQSDIAQFQRAAAIRDAFFPAPMQGQQILGLRFDLMPMGLDPGARGAVLEVEGAKTAISPGAAGARPVPMQWPSRGPVILTFDPPAAIGSLSGDGAWAALRFVASGRLMATNMPDRLRLSLQSGGRSVEFELRAASIVHSVRSARAVRFPLPAASALTRVLAANSSMIAVSVETGG